MPTLRPAKQGKVKNNITYLILKSRVPGRGVDLQERKVSDTYLEDEEGAMNGPKGTAGPRR